MEKNYKVRNLGSAGTDMDGKITGKVSYASLNGVANFYESIVIARTEKLRISTGVTMALWFRRLLT